MRLRYPCDGLLREGLCLPKGQFGPYFLDRGSGSIQRNSSASLEAVFAFSRQALR